MKFYKKWWFWTILILLALFIFGATFFKSTCGLYNFAAPYSEDCNCIGIKTDPCAGITGSCDKGISNCIGIRKDCFRTWHINQSKEIISCRE